MAKTIRDQGQDLHKLIENYLDPKSPVHGVQPTIESEALQLLWKSAMPIISRITDVRALEVPVFSEALNYAGTVDCIARFPSPLVRLSSTLLMFTQI